MFPVTNHHFEQGLDLDPHGETHMPKAFVVLVCIALSAFAACPSLSDDLHQKAAVPSGAEKLPFIYPNNIDCRDFDRTAYKVWHLRDRSAIDLGNWDRAFEISGPISRGLFVKKGFDLFDVLEAKCGMSA